MARHPLRRQVHSNRGVGSDYLYRWRYNDLFEPGPLAKVRETVLLQGINPDQNVQLPCKKSVVAFRYFKSHI